MNKQSAGAIKKTNANKAAVVEIGSNYVSMTISQLQKGKISTLEKLEYPLSLGHDVYLSGSISFESLRSLSNILMRFDEPIKAYSVGKVKFISGSVMREAANRTLVADQLKVQNNCSIDVLDSNMEKSYMFYEVVKSLNDDFKNKNTLICYVGSGSISVAVYDGQNIILSQTVSLGTSKLSDIIAVLRKNEENYHEAIEEYIVASLSPLSARKLKIDRLVFAGTEISSFASMLGIGASDSVISLSPEKTYEMYESIKQKTPHNISMQHDITEDEADILQSSLFIYVGVMRLTKSKQVFASLNASVAAAITSHLLLASSKTAFLDFIRQSSEACAINLATGCGYNSKHADIVSDIASNIFDGLRKIHGLDKSNKIILRIAAIMQPCAQLSNLNQRSNAVFDYINNIDAFGMTQSEMTVTAFVASSIYGAGKLEDFWEYRALSVSEQITIKKLSAIFMLASAFDISYKAKISTVKVNVKDNKIDIRALAKKDCALEKWTFEEYSSFFKEVFGIYPELIIKE